MISIAAIIQWRTLDAMKGKLEGKWETVAEYRSPYFFGKNPKAMMRKWREQENKADAHLERLIKDPANADKFFVIRMQREEITRMAVPNQMDSRKLQEEETKKRVPRSHPMGRRPKGMEGMPGRFD